MVATPRPVRASLNERLSAALPWHYEQDHAFRDSHRELVRDFAGRTTYPDWLNGLGEIEFADKKQIVNLTMQACQAFVMNLAANRPRFLTTPCYAAHAPFANRMRRTLDRYAKQLYLEEVLKDFARNSWFSAGICKVYQSNSAAVGMDADYRMAMGQPFAQSLSILKVVRDTDAESPDKAAFIGDVYSIDYWEAIESRRFTRKARAAIKELSPTSWRDGPDDERDTNHGPLVDDSLYLCDVFVRRGKTGPEVRTYVVDRRLNFLIPRAVQVIPWKGEQCGPYYFLNMGPVPGHFWPSSPGINQRLLQEFTNTVYRKLEDQSRRMKSILTANNDEDATLATAALDGECKRFADPGSISEIRIAGPDSQLFGMLMNSMQQYSRANNNLDAQLGLGPSADTASQERMIGAMVGKMGQFYQGEYVAAVRQIARGLARLLWQDSKLHVPGAYEIPGTNFVVQDDWMPAELPNAREGDFEFYDIDVDPYSLPYQSPSERAGKVEQMFMAMLPAAPYFAENGIRLDPVAFVELMSDYYSIHEMRRVFQANQPPLDAQGPSHQRTLPSGQPHEYIHRSAGSAGGQSEPDPMQFFAQQKPAQGPIDG